MNKETQKGEFKGELCNRNGCTGIIDAYEKEGSCTCHRNPPCSYCTTMTEYCPICGWSAQEEQDAYLKEYAKKQTPFVYQYKSDEQRFNELKDGEFDYIRLNSGAPSVVRLKGKHPNMSRGEIYEILDLQENPNMPRMKQFSNKTFELTYFCD